MTQKQTVHLQGVGQVKARPVGELEIGDRIAKNYGWVYEVVQVVKETPKTRTLALKSERSGQVFEQRLGKATLAAIVS